MLLLVAGVSRYLISPWVKSKVVGLYKKSLVAPSATPGAIPQIKDYAVSGNFPPIKFDLNNDSKEETVVAYYGTTQGQTEGCQQTEPVILKIYSGNNETFSLKTSPKDIYFFNEINHLSTETDLGGKTYVFFGEDVSGCGSGFQALNYFISYHPETNDYKADLNFPSSELSNIFIKNFSPKHPGREIMITRAVWNETESHFESHKQKVSIYYWNGDFWNLKELGTTQSKHFDENGMAKETIDQLLGSELKINSELKKL